MKKSILAAAVLSLAAATPAYATVYNLDLYDANFTGNLGTVTVSGEGTNTLNFSVSLANNVFFQMPGNDKPHDVFWFDLVNTVSGVSSPFSGSITSSITTPSGGAYPTGAQFAIVGPGSLGQGWSSGDYGATDQDTVGGTDYYHGVFEFSLSAIAGTHLTLGSASHDGETYYGGADLRQCPTSSPTAGTCVTGPVGFTLQDGGTPGQTAVVPEPATWAMMLVGFGLIGSVMRRRKHNPAVRFNFA